MFTSEKIETFLQSVKFAGEKDASTLKCSLYITPLTFAIADELSDRIAKKLFDKQGSVYAPVAEFDNLTLELGQMPMYNFEFYPHNVEGADGAGQMVPSCSIGKVEAKKLFSDKPDFSLVFEVTLPMNSNSIELMRKYYKKKFFLTLEESQAVLEDKKGPAYDESSVIEAAVPLYCQGCNAKAEFLGNDTSAWCGPHVAAAVGITVKKIKYVTGASA